MFDRLFRKSRKEPKGTPGADQGLAQGPYGPYNPAVAAIAYAVYTTTDIVEPQLGKDALRAVLRHGLPLIADGPNPSTVDPYVLASVVLKRHQENEQQPNRPPTARGSGLPVVKP